MTYAAALKANPDALSMRDRPFSGEPSDLPRWMADIKLHVTGIAGQLIWRAFADDALDPAGYPTLEEDEQRDLILQFSNASKVV